MMLKSKKYSLAVALFAALLAVFGAAFAVLSSRTFYPDLVFSKVQAALASSAGFDLSAERLEGNPITGVLGSGVTFSQGGAAVISADRIEMYLSLRSLISGKPKLASMRLVGLRADLDEVMRSLPAKEEPEKQAEPPALDSLVLQDTRLQTKWGPLVLERGEVGIGADRYDLDLRGSFADKPLSAAGTYVKEGDAARIEGAVLDWAGQSVSAEGALSPELSLACEFERIDVDALASVLPALKRATVSGVYAGTANLEGAEGLRVTARLASDSGRVWRLPFTSLQADVRYEENRVELSGVRAAIFGAEAEGRAAIVLSGDAPNLAVNFGIRNLETKAMAAEFDFLEKYPATVAFASCDIRGPVDRLSGPVYLDIPRLRAEGFDITDAKATIALRGDAPLRVDFSGKALGSAAAASGTVSLSAPNSLDIAASLRPLSLASLAKRYPEIERMKIAGDGTVSAKIQGPANDLTVRGDVAFPKIRIREYALEDLKAEFGYGASGLSLKAARARWNGAEITAKGDLHMAHPASADRTQTLDFHGAFTNLDLKALGGQVSAIGENGVQGVVSGHWSLGGEAKNPVASFDLTIPQLQAGAYATLSQIGVRGGYRSPDIEIAKADARFGSALIAADGRVTLAAGSASPAYEFKGNFKDLDLRQVPALLESLPNSADIAGRLNGDLRVWSGEGGAPQARVFFKDSAIVAGKVEFQDLRGSLELEGNDLKITNVSAGLHQGNLRLNGRVRDLLAPKTGAKGESAEGAGLPLDLRVEVTSVDMGRVARIFSPSAHGYQGLIVASADVRGTTAAPSFTANGSLMGVRAFGLFLPRIRFTDVSGGPDSVKLPTIQAIAGRGRISASGDLTREGDTWTGSVSASGKSVDIRSLTFSLEDELRRTITGALDFDFEGKGSLPAFEGSGALYVPALNVMGFKLTEARAPFYVSEGFIMVEDSSAHAYNGRVMLQIAKDLGTSDWGGRVEITSVDLGPVLPDLIPGMGGSITGKTNFKLRFGGDSRRTSMQDGEGSLEIRDGEVSGFEGAAAVSKMVGGRPLRFDSAHSSFNIDGKTLYLLPGSRVSAPKGDPVFKYVMVDGSVSLAKSIDISCVGNVNVRALNTFAGAVQGLLAGVVDGQGEMLHNFLGGAITGLSRNEFRDVSLQAKGAPGDLKFQNVQIAQQEKAVYIPDALADPEHSKEKEQEKIRINLEFPVGPGSSGGRDGSAASQVGGQVLEQAIKGALKF